MKKRRSNRTKSAARPAPQYFRPGWGMYKYNGRESTRKFHYMTSPTDTLCRFIGPGMLEQIPHHLTPLDEDACWYCQRRLARQQREAEQKAQQHKGQYTLTF